MPATCAQRLFFAVPALKINDPLAVVLNGLCGQHAAMVVLELAAQLTDQLARHAQHQLKGFLGFFRAGQAHEQAQGLGGKIIDLFQVEGTRIEGVGHGEQLGASSGHGFVAMEDVHLAKTHATLQHRLQDVAAIKAVVATGFNVNDEDFLLMRLDVELFLHLRFLGHGLLVKVRQNRLIIAGIADKWLVLLGHAHIADDFGVVRRVGKLVDQLAIQLEFKRVTSVVTTQPIQYDQEYDDDTTYHQPLTQAHNKTPITNLETNSCTETAVLSPAATTG